MIPWWIAAVSPLLPSILVYLATRSGSRRTDQDFYRQKITDLEAELGLQKAAHASEMLELRGELGKVVADSEKKTAALLIAHQMQLEHAWQQVREEKERAARYETTAERERSKFQSLAIETASQGEKK